MVCCFFFALCIFWSCSSQNRLPGYVYFRLTANPTTLDPALIVDVTGGAISAKLFNGLVRIGDDLSIQPDIAQHWAISHGGTAYTFTLKKGVYFPNRREVNAHDFKYAFTRIADPKTKSPNSWIFENIIGVKDYMSGRADDIKGIVVKDDHTLEIRLEKPFSPFLSLLTMTAAYVVPKEEVEKWGADFSSHPVGTGPFLLTRWLPNREIVLQKREDYFEERCQGKRHYLPHNTGGPHSGNGIRDRQHRCAHDPRIRVFTVQKRPGEKGFHLLHQRPEHLLSWHELLETAFR